MHLDLLPTLPVIICYLASVPLVASVMWGGQAKLV